MPEKIVRKYKAELEIAKECFCLMSEKQKVCALFPLASFCDNNKHFLLTGVMPEPVKIVR